MMRLLIGLMFCGSAVWAGPRLVCDQPVYDFGTQVGCEEIVHTFRVWNRGDAPATISKLKTCCGVKSTLSAMEVPVGSNVVCRAVFDTKRRSGKQDKQLLIASNDRQHPYLELKLVGTLQPAIQLETKYLRVKNLCPDGSWEQEVTVTRLTEEPVVLERISCSVSGFGAEVISTNQNGWTVHVFSTDALQSGKVSGAVSLHLSSGKERINLMGQVEPVLQCTPEAIRVVFSKEPVERLVLVKSSDGRPFEVTGADVSGAVEAVTSEKVAEGKWRLRVRVIPADLPPRAVLTIQTDCALQTEVRVPIRL